MIRSLTLVFLSLALIGCIESNKESSNISDYSCSEEQMKEVEREFEICKRTEYLTAHCYSELRKSYCTKVSSK